IAGSLELWRVSLITHVMIKTMKPLMREAASTGILSQRQLPGCRNVVRRHTGLTANTVLQTQLTAQRNDRFRYAQRLHQLHHRLIKLFGRPVAFGTGNPAANLNAVEAEATAYFHKRWR